MGTRNLGNYKMISVTQPRLAYEQHLHGMCMTATTNETLLMEIFFLLQAELLKSDLFHR